MTAFAGTALAPTPTASTATGAAAAAAAAAATAGGNATVLNVRDTASALEPPPPPPPPPPVPARDVVLAVGFYIGTSITMVMVNKLVLKEINEPLTFLWLQVLVAVAMFAGAQAAGLLKLPSLDWAVCRALTPLVAVNVVGLSLNTLCLHYVQASFYQVARALILPFTVALTRLLLGTTFSATVLGACAVVFVGFLVGVRGEVDPSLVGVVFGVASSVTTAFHAIIIKRSLAVVDDQTLVLAYYNNVLTAVYLVPVVLLAGERALLADVIGLRVSTTFLVGTVVAGVFGFLINVAGFLQIKVTSPVTHMISSALRGVLQTLVAVVCFGDVVSAGNAVGIALVLAGSSWYTWARHHESQAQPGARSR